MYLEGFWWFVDDEVVVVDFVVVVIEGDGDELGCVFGVVDVDFGFEGF